MRDKPASKIIDEMHLSGGKTVNFTMLYDSGFSLVDRLLREGEVASARMYLYLARNMERNHGALVTDVPSLVEELGISKATAYRSIDTLTKSGHLMRRHRNLFEINPDGAWKGKSDRKNNATFMKSGNKSTTNKSRLRLKPGSKSENAISIATCFESDNQEGREK